MLNIILLTLIEQKGILGITLLLNLLLIAHGFWITNYDKIHQKESGLIALINISAKSGEEKFGFALKHLILLKI